MLELYLEYSIFRLGSKFTTKNENWVENFKYWVVNLLPIYIYNICIYENVFNNYFDPNCISPIYINHMIILFKICNFE